MIKGRSEVSSVPCCSSSSVASICCFMISSFSLRFFCASVSISPASFLRWYSSLASLMRFSSCSRLMRSASSYLSRSSSSFLSRSSSSRLRFSSSSFCFCFIARIFFPIAVPPFFPLPFFPPPPGAPASSAGTSGASSASAGGASLSSSSPANFAALRFSFFLRFLSCAASHPRPTLGQLLLG